MQFRQKIGYMALGGLLVLGGHVLPGVVAPKASAQVGLESAEFDTVTVRNLWVLDDVGRVRAGIVVGPNGGVMSMLGNDGKPRATMAANAHGGVATMLGEDGVQHVVIGVLPGGGYMSVLGNDGRPYAGMAAGPVAAP